MLGAFGVDAIDDPPSAGDPIDENPGFRAVPIWTMAD
jgi:hypothetical protein